MKLFRLCALLLGMFMAHTAASADIRVVVSIAPIHSLVAGVMEGVGAPRLLVRGGASPHSFAMRPSDSRAMNEADLIIWVGEGLESFLPKVLASLSPGAKITELMENPRIRLLDGRKPGVWDDHEHSGKDPHIWLSPENAKAIARISADALIKRDPDNAKTYAANVARVAEGIDQAARTIGAQIAPLADEPFVMFHDSFRYFEEAFDLKPLGALTVNPERMPGARRLARLRHEMARRKVKCVFREPQFSPKTVAMVAEGSGAQIGVIDPLGADLPPGPALFLELMHNNAHAITACLS